MDYAAEWLKYLESRQSGAQADFRLRSTVTIPSAITLLIGSIIFIQRGGLLIMGLIGIGVAFLVLGASLVYNLKSVVFISGCDTIIKRILLGQLVESAEINKAVNELISRYAAMSAVTEGLEIVKRTAEKRS
jgi:sensor histidine kinase YesM